MYSPGWYVSDDHFFTWLFKSVPTSSCSKHPIGYFGPMRDSQNIIICQLNGNIVLLVSTLLQSTRRLKLSFVTPPIFLWATLASLFFPAHSKCSVKFFSRNNFMLSYEESAVPIMPMQTTYFSEQKGLCFVFAWVLLWQQRGITSDEE